MKKIKKLMMVLLIITAGVSMTACTSNNKISEEQSIEYAKDKYKDLISLRNEEQGLYEELYKTMLGNNVANLEIHHPTNKNINVLKDIPKTYNQKHKVDTVLFIYETEQQVKDYAIDNTDVDLKKQFEGQPLEKVNLITIGTEGLKEDTLHFKSNEELSNKGIYIIPSVVFLDNEYNIMGYMLNTGANDVDKMIDEINNYIAGNEYNAPVFKNVGFKDGYSVIAKDMEILQVKAREELTGIPLYYKDENGDIRDSDDKIVEMSEDEKKKLELFEKGSVGEDGELKRLEDIKEFNNDVNNLIGLMDAKEKGLIRHWNTDYVTYDMIQSSYGYDMGKTLIQNLDTKEYSKLSEVIDTDKATLVATGRVTCPYCVELIKEYNEIDRSKSPYNLIYLSTEGSREEYEKEIGTKLQDNLIFKLEDSMQEETGVIAVPTLYILNKNQQVVTTMTSAVPKEEIEMILNRTEEFNKK